MLACSLLAVCPPCTCQIQNGMHLIPPPDNLTFSLPSCRESHQPAQLCRREQPGCGGHQPRLRQHRRSLPHDIASAEEGHRWRHTRCVVASRRKQSGRHQLIACQLAPNTLSAARSGGGATCMHGARAMSDALLRLQLSGARLFRGPGGLCAAMHKQSAAHPHPAPAPFPCPTQSLASRPPRARCTLPATASRRTPAPTPRAFRPASLRGSTQPPPAVALSPPTRLTLPLSGEPRPLL